MNHLDAIQIQFTGATTESGSQNKQVPTYYELNEDVTKQQH